MKRILLCVAAGAFRLMTDPAYDEEQKSIRGVVFAGAAMPVEKASADQPPTLLVHGDQGLEVALAPSSAGFAANSQRQGAQSRHVIVEGRDHLTLISNMARTGDAGRAAVLDFIGPPA